LGQVGALPSTFVYAFFNFLISPLYGNSVMANLNSRDYVRGQRDTTDASLELSGVQFAIQRKNNVCLLGQGSFLESF
jgi:hypothetical protein